MIPYPVVVLGVFNIGWLACVLGAASGFPWLGLACAMVLVPLHVYWRGTPAADARYLAAAAGLGLTFDALLTTLGILRFPEHVTVAGAPLWLLGLWLMFPAMAASCLGWLRPYTALTVAFGAVGGSLTYYIGARLGALELHPDLMLSLGALAIAWAILFPLIIRLVPTQTGR